MPDMKPDQLSAIMLRFALFSGRRGECCHDVLGENECLARSS
jgi:hypothetical protein